MKGWIDDAHRALVTVSVSARIEGPDSSITAWIDTAFDGHLVMSSTLISQLGLDSLAETEAILADGSKVTLESYYCYLDWFGERKPVQVIENEGHLPLLGTGLLADRDLYLSYRSGELTMT